jgi:hypothetical protein
MSAAVASILDLQLDEVPNWVTDAFDEGKPHLWHERMGAWFSNRGLHLVSLKYAHFGDWRMLVGAYAIASMPSQRFADTTHAVICTWGKLESGCHQIRIAHDPNPNNRQYDLDKEEPRYIYFVVPKQPRVCA